MSPENCQNFLRKIFSSPLAKLFSWIAHINCIHAILKLLLRLEHSVMALVFDIRLYQVTRDIDMALLVKESNTKPPKPKTMALQSFAIHAKQIIYFQSHGNAWKTTSAEALAEAVKNHRIAIHQLSPYRTRVIAFDSKVWFFDLYFSQCFTSSDTWERKMMQLLEETTNNGGFIGITLLKRFYPLRECLSDLPKIDWKRLECEPFIDN